MAIKLDQWADDGANQYEGEIRGGETVAMDNLSRCRVRNPDHPSTIIIRGTERRVLMKHTCRGFRIYSEFLDSYKSEVRIQESSSAEGRYCWIFTKKAGEGDIDWAPHLSVYQAKRVVKALEKFIAGN